MNDPRQVELVMLDQLVPGDHPYRKILDLVDFERLCEAIVSLDNSRRGAKGFGVVTLFRCLMLQFIEDLSDRELAAVSCKRTTRPSSSAGSVSPTARPTIACSRKPEAGSARSVCRLCLRRCAISSKAKGWSQRCVHICRCHAPDLPSQAVARA